MNICLLTDGDLQPDDRQMSKTHTLITSVNKKDDTIKTVFNVGQVWDQTFPLSYLSSEIIVQ